jgi:hypothetical protein
LTPSQTPVIAAEQFGAVSAATIAELSRVSRLRLGLFTSAFAGSLWYAGCRDQVEKAARSARDRAPKVCYRRGAVAADRDLIDWFEWTFAVDQAAATIKPTYHTKGDGPTPAMCVVGRQPTFAAAGIRDPGAYLPGRPLTTHRCRRRHGPERQVLDAKPCLAVSVAAPA